MARRKFESAVAGAPTRVKRTIPARAPSLSADVAVPAVTGLIIGVLAGIVPAILLAAIMGGAFLAAWAGFASVFSVAAIVWRLPVTDASLWATERIETSAPTIPEGLEMPALPEPQERMVLLSPYAGRAALEADKRRDADSALADFIRECEGQDNTTARHWEPKIGRAQYTTWRRQLFESGWADHKTGNERDGWELTAPAATICEALDL